MWSVFALLFLGLHIKTVSGCITIRTTLLMCSVDLPARSLWANMKQFNRQYGCIYCENPGTPRLSCPSARDWLPGSHNLRTHQSIIQNAKEATESREAVYANVMYDCTINVQHGHYTCACSVCTLICFNLFWCIRFAGLREHLYFFFTLPSIWLRGL